MAKSKRTPRAKNKIAGAQAGELIKVEPDRFVDAPQAEQRVRVVARSTLFTAELEAVIEIIATERVYRAMLDGLKRRLLTATPPLLIESPEAFE
jgi:hypothetical protein